MYKLPKFHDELYEASWSEKCVCVLIDREWGLLQRLGFLQKLVKMLHVCVCLDFLKRSFIFIWTGGKLKFKNKPYNNKISSTVIRMMQ